jgi:hypothetical protein
MRAHRKLPAVMVAFIASAGAMTVAYADVYNWVDREGTVTASNLTPPEGVRVTKVVHTSAKEKAAVDAARAAQLQALSDRVRDLEQQVQSAKSGPPPDVAFPPMIAAPPMPYASNRMPAVQQYVVVEPPPSPPNGNPYGCDPTWASCWSSFYGPLVYPGVVLVNGSGHRHHAHRGGGHNGSRHGGAQRRTQPRAVARAN